MRSTDRPLQFGDTKIKKLNRSQKFVPADQVSQEEATTDQQKHAMPHAQGPYGVYPTDTVTGARNMDYVTTNSRVAPNNQQEDPSSLASRIAHRRVARTKVSEGDRRAIEHPLPRPPCAAAPLPHSSLLHLPHLPHPLRRLPQMELAAPCPMALP